MLAPSLTDIMIFVAVVGFVAAYVGSVYVCLRHEIKDSKNNK